MIRFLLRTITYSLVAFASVLLSSCRTFTENVSPAPEEGIPDAPASYLHANEEKAISPTLSLQEWWLLYEDPILESLIIKLGIANPDIEAAMAKVDQSFAVLGLTRGSLLPTVGSENFAERRGDSVNNLLFPIDSPEYSRYNLGVSASWEMDLWGRVRGSVKRDRLRAEAEEFHFRDILLSLQANLTRQYFALQTANKEIEILQNAVRIREENSKLQESRLALGMGVDVDVARAQLDLHNAKAGQEATQRNLEKIKHSIAILTGTTPSDLNIEFPSAQEKPLPQIPIEVPSTLLQHRADLRAAEKMLQSAAIQIGVRTADYLPTITLNGSGGIASLKTANLFEADSKLFDIGPNIKIPIFKLGSRKSAIAQANAQWQEAKANYRSTLLTAVQEVEDALLNLKSLKKELTLRQEAVNAATRAVTAAKNRHESGLASFFEFIEAERELLQAKLLENTIKGELKATSVSLIQALGGKWGNDAL